MMGIIYLVIGVGVTAYFMDKFNIKQFDSAEVISFCLLCTIFWPVYLIYDLIH